MAIGMYGMQAETSVMTLITKMAKKVATGLCGMRKESSPWKESTEKKQTQPE
jgi:hypothetical protein